MKKVLCILIAFAALTFGCKKSKQPTGPELTTTAATTVTANGAQTGGNITSDGGMSVTKRGIVWATHTSPALSDSLTSNGTGTGPFTTSLMTLFANTTYYIRAYAINSVATTYGNEITFTTAKGAPGVKTTTATAVDATSGIAAGGGNVVTDGGAPVTARGVVYSTTPHPTIASSLTSDGTGTGAFTSSMGPFTANKTYYYRAYATNSYGTSYGAELTLGSGNTATVTDYDGNVYGTVTIGTQTWMTSNLKVIHYQNGDPITDGSGASFNFNGATVGVFTYPNGDINNNGLYGKLYNGYAVEDTRNIAPVGWHVPTDAEWQTLEVFEGMAPTDAAVNGYRGTIGAKLTVGGSSGLGLQNAGYLLPSGTYSSFGTAGLYASNTTTVAPSFFFRGFNVQASNPTTIYRAASLYIVSVRCVKN